MHAHHDPAVDTMLLASRQQGNVARRQLLALGLAPTTVDSRVAQGRLIVVFRGVYALGYRREDPLARAAAAVLACGEDAVLSHDSAAALWSGLRRWPRDPEVTTPRRIDPNAINAHRSCTLTRAQVTRQHGIRTTTVARTLRDIRTRLTPEQFTRLVNDARIRRLLSQGAAAVLLGEGESTGPTRSEFEDAFLAMVRDHGLPVPLVDTTLHGREVDALFPDERVIVELDGWDTHRSRASFDSDRERDAAHAELGFLTVRVTWPRLTHAPEREARRLETILAHRRGG
jgi:very-short-patch-repair endonuclease